MREIPLSAFWNRGREASSKIDGRCPSYNDIIEPYTKVNLMRHLGTKHIAIIDLDFTRVYSSRAVDGLLIDFDKLVSDDLESELPDPDGEKDCGRYFEKGYEDEKEILPGLGQHCPSAVEFP